MGAGGSISRRRVEHLWPIMVTAVVVAASLFPITWDDSRDSFPLTPYPMFSDRRDSAVVQLVLAVGETDGGLVVLPTEATGHRHVTQAARALAGAVVDGGARPARLCEEIADWVTDSTVAGVGTVRIVTVKFDGVAYFTEGDQQLNVVRDHASCEVDG